MSAKGFDIVSPKITLYYSGSLSHSTSFSMFLTVIYFIVILIITLLYCIEILSNKYKIILYYKTFLKDYGKISFNSTNFQHHLILVGNDGRIKSEKKWGRPFGMVWSCAVWRRLCVPCCAGTRRIDAHQWRRLMRNNFPDSWHTWINWCGRPVWLMRMNWRSVPHHFIPYAQDLTHRRPRSAAANRLERAISHRKWWLSASSAAFRAASRLDGCAYRAADLLRTGHFPVGGKGAFAALRPRNVHLKLKFPGLRLHSLRPFGCPSRLILHFFCTPLVRERWVMVYYAAFSVPGD